jgi:repressor LexA
MPVLEDGDTTEESMVNDRARQILAYIQKYSLDHGYPPTIREVGKAFGIQSTNGVRYHLQVLERAGQLKRIGRISRGIGPVQAARRTAGIPILGRVAAGAPILAEESLEGHLSPAEVFGDPAGLFALRVRGDSMVEAGILEGDYVVVRKQSRANPGEIIVGLLGDEATVKYWRPRGDHAELVPANSRYQPIGVGRSLGREPDFRILGVVTGVIRTLGR